MAPVVRLAVLLKTGRLELVTDATLLAFSTDPVLASKLLEATPVLKAFRLEKYNALPSPVRMTLGNVPRHRLLNASGPEIMERNVGSRFVERDC